VEVPAIMCDIEIPFLPGEREGSCTAHAARHCMRPTIRKEE